MLARNDGAEIHYSARGDGPACLVLSAIGIRPYERMMSRAISDRLKLVFVDLRGSGRSTGSPSDLTFERLTADLEAVRLDLGLDRVAVMGHSIVGALALEYGRRCPTSVSHVILVGTPPIGDMAAVAAASASFFEADASEDRKQALRENLSKLAPDASMGDRMYAHTPMRFYDAGFDARPLFADSDTKPLLLRHLMTTLLPSWSASTAVSPALRVPILIAHGRYDYTVPHALWDRATTQLPNTTVEIFERSGHQPFFEESDRFAASVIEWMRDHDRRETTGAIG